MRRRQRVLWLLVATAVAAASAGWLASTAVRSPEQAARDTRPLDPSPITAPVEARVLTSTIVTRGDANHAGATEVRVDLEAEAADGGGQPVVTGRLPRAGDELGEGDLAIEVSGRPVFLLAGDLPMYRRIGPGTTGPDVAQLEAALERLGFPPGPVDEVFDQDTAAAVDSLYRDAGYQPLGASEADRERLAGAEEQERSARDALADAEAALAEARQGPGHAELVAAEGDVAVAAAELEKARADRDEALAAAAPADRARVRREHDLTVLRAERHLVAAEARLAELRSPPDTGPHQAAVHRAEEALEEARETVATLRAAHGTAVARGEVLFLPDLPRLVEEVQVGLGDLPTGPVLTLSGTELLVESRVSAAERQLLAVGDRVTLDEPALGVELAGTIVALPEPTEPGTHPVRIRPDPVAGGSDPLAGTNLRVTIPVGSTGGEVLAVPAAAVHTTVDGASWVRVATSDGAAVDVEVRVGLSADGYLEVTPVGAAGELVAGDEVVLGRR